MVGVAVVNLDCECSVFCHAPNVTCQPPSTASRQLDVKNDTNLFPVIYIFSFLHIGTAFMVILQFRGHLVRRYLACVVDSLGLELHVLYHYTMCTRHPNLVISSLYSTF